MSFEPNVYDTYSNDLENQEQGGKGLAIASLVLGIIALISGVIFFISIPCGLISIILAIVSLVKKRKGKPLAIVGIITSIIGEIFGILLIVLCMPFINLGMEISSNPEMLNSMIEEYEENGTIPEEVLDIFHGDEEMSNVFMEEFYEAYNDVSQK